jgi:hypothetical protein
VRENSELEVSALTRAIIIVAPAQNEWSRGKKNWIEKSAFCVT